MVNKSSTDLLCTNLSRVWQTSCLHGIISLLLVVCWHYLSTAGCCCDICCTFFQIIVSLSGLCVPAGGIEYNTRVYFTIGLNCFHIIFHVVDFSWSWRWISGLKWWSTSQRANRKLLFYFWFSRCWFEWVSVCVNCILAPWHYNQSPQWSIRT